TGIVNTGNRCVLLSRGWRGIPAGIEEDEQGADMTLSGEFQELIEALTISHRSFLPHQIMEEYTHGSHAQTLGPAEFKIDAVGIERFRLPHFELVNGIGR